MDQISNKTDDAAAMARVPPPPTGSAEEMDDYRDFCMTCGGDGYETSDDLMEEDPLWWEGVDMIQCRNCGGTGRAKDQCYW